MFFFFFIDMFLVKQVQVNEPQQPITASVFFVVFFNLLGNPIQGSGESVPIKCIMGLEARYTSKVARPSQDNPRKTFPFLFYHLVRIPGCSHFGVL